MAKIVIDQYGTKTYYNDDNLRHRDDGPAVIWTNGYLEYFLDGVTFSEEMNPDVRPDGTRMFFNWRIAKNERIEHFRHRSNGPAMDFSNGYKQWWEDEYRIWPKL